MPQSLSKIAIHLIYSTKNREPFLHKSELRSDLAGFQVGIFKKLNSPSIITKTMADHAHSLFLLSRTYTIAQIVELVKKDSSKWVHNQAITRNDPRLQNFHWQNGYGAFSVSESNIPQVKAYIQNQDAHHRTVTFQEEYRVFLKRHKIPHDERYVWD